jgi:hypothetical protein
MFAIQKYYRNTLAIILIASMASAYQLLQPGYSTIITSNNGSNTSISNNQDVSKEVFVVDYANIRIQKVDSSGGVYVTDMIDLSVKKFTEDGKFITKWGTEGTDDNQFQDPHSVVVY